MENKELSNLKPKTREKKMKKMKSLRKMHDTIKHINICKIEYQKKSEISKKKKNQRNNRTLPNLLKTKIHTSGSSRNSK